eukprot:scaffold9154_cov28-Tisochrysis_lutea.AAC.1
MTPLWLARGGQSGTRPLTTSEQSTQHHMVFLLHMMQRCCAPVARGVVLDHLELELGQVVAVAVASARRRRGRTRARGR